MQVTESYRYMNSQTPPKDAPVTCTLNSWNLFSKRDFFSGDIVSKFHCQCDNTTSSEHEQNSIKWNMQTNPPGIRITTGSNNGKAQRINNCTSLIISYMSVGGLRFYGGTPTLMVDLGIMALIIMATVSAKWRMSLERSAKSSDLARNP